MEFDSVADAWYVWVGVAVVSVGIAGVALGIPTTPPPDANEAANAVDRVAASEHGASAHYDHDADEVKIGTRQLSLRNAGGTRYATVSVGSLTPVAPADAELARMASQLIDGKPVDRVVAEFDRVDDAGDLRTAFAELRAQIDRDGARWRHAEGDLRARSIRLDGTTVVLIDG